MVTQPIYALTDTWTNAVTSYDGIKMNVTDAASAADSKLINLQVGGVAKCTVDKNGILVAAGDVKVGSNSVWHAGNLTPAILLTQIKTVDGPGSGLDADLLDGQEGAYYLPAATYSAADILSKLATVDGSGSGLDADKVRGTTPGTGGLSLLAAATVSDAAIAMGGPFTPSPYLGSSASNTDFPIGSYILVSRTSTPPARNGTGVVYISDGANANAYVASNVGFGVLSGTWRARGLSSDSTQFGSLMQRVS